MGILEDVDLGGAEGAVGTADADAVGDEVEFADADGGAVGVLTWGKTGADAEAGGGVAGGRGRVGVGGIIVTGTGELEIGLETRKLGELELGKLGLGLEPLLLDELELELRANRLGLELREMELEVDEVIAVIAETEGLAFVLILGLKLEFDLGEVELGKAPSA